MVILALKILLFLNKSVTCRLGLILYPSHLKQAIRDWEGKKEILFNNTHDIFYFMVRWHETYAKRPLSKIGNPLPPLHGILLLPSIKGGFFIWSLRQESTHHSLYYTSHGALVWTRNNSMCLPWGVNLMTSTVGLFLVTLYDTDIAINKKYMLKVLLNIKVKYF